MFAAETFTPSRDAEVYLRPLNFYLSVQRTTRLLAAPYALSRLAIHKSNRGNISVLDSTTLLTVPIFTCLLSKHSLNDRTLALTI